MLVVGVLLIVAGLALAYFADEFRRAARVAYAVGALLALVGVALIVVDVFDLDNADAAVQVARSSWSRPL